MKGETLTIPAQLSDPPEISNRETSQTSEKPGNKTFFPKSEEGSANIETKEETNPEVPPVQTFVKNWKGVPTSKPEGYYSFIQKNPVIKLENIPELNSFIKEKITEPVQVQWTEPTQDPPSDEEEGEDWLKESVSENKGLLRRQIHLAELGGAPKAGTRRRMVPFGLSPTEHKNAAQSLIHPIDMPSTVNTGLRTVIERNAKKTNSELIAERLRDKEWLVTTAANLREENEKLLDQCPVNVQKILRKPNFTVNLALIAKLLEMTDHEDKDFLSLMSEGSELIGEFKRTGLWKPLSKRKINKDKITIDQFKEQIPETQQKVRNREGAGAGFEQELWDASLKDVREGWAEGPFETREQIQAFLGEEVVVEVPRFQVTQPRPQFTETSSGERVITFLQKTRAVDDQSITLVNSAARIKETMSCASPDSIAAAIRLINELGDNSPLAAAAVDVKSAFRTIPVNKSHLKYAVPSVYNPETQSQAYLALLGNPFGSVSSVHSFCRFSMFVRKVALRILKVPIDFFFDDFWCVENSGLLPSSIDLVKTLFAVLGWQTVVEKDQQTGSPVLLGVQYNLEENTVSVPEIKREKWSLQIKEYLDRKKISSTEAAKLKGALQWVSSQLFCVEAKPLLHELSRKQYKQGDDNQTNIIGKRLEKALKQLLEILRNPPVRKIPGPRKPGDHMVIYTDGMNEKNQPMGIGGVLFPPKDSGQIGQWWASVVPEKVQALWKPREQPIALIEAFGVLVAFRTWFPALPEQSRVILFCDNSVTHACLCRGSAQESDMRRIIEEIRKLVVRHQIFLWVEWVESEANPADAPSRITGEGASAKVKAAFSELQQWDLTEVKNVNNKGY